MKHNIDRKALKVILAVLDMDLRDLAEHTGYDHGYVVNILNGFTPPSASFRRALGDTIATLVLGASEAQVQESYPAAPLMDLIERAASQARSKREFYADIGTSAQALKKHSCFDGVFVDRICCALGVHPSSVYGGDYDIEEAS